jgi:hypothetical protein
MTQCCSLKRGISGMPAFVARRLIGMPVDDEYFWFESGASADVCHPLA